MSMFGDQAFGMSLGDQAFGTPLGDPLLDQVAKMATQVKEQAAAKDAPKSLVSKIKDQLKKPTVLAGLGIVVLGSGYLLFRGK